MSTEPTKQQRAEAKAWVISWTKRQESVTDLVAQVLAAERS